MMRVLNILDIHMEILNKWARTKNGAYYNALRQCFL